MMVSLSEPESGEGVISLSCPLLGASLLKRDMVDVVDQSNIDISPNRQ